MKTEIKILYLLENEYIYILEVQLLNIPKDVTASERFKWMRIDKNILHISSLNFQSIDSAGEIEERWFEEGYLKFNLNEGTFIEKYNSDQHKLDRNLENQIPIDLQHTIEAFLSNEKIKA